MLKRMIDLAILLICAVIFAIPCLLIGLAIKIDSRGPILFWSQRIGRFSVPFMMPKFRTMKVDSPIVATHLLRSPESYLTRVGRLLRLTSLDELPQLWSIATGVMSFVGPRPALFTQLDLIESRTSLGVDKLLPGLTGWAQINGRDEIPLGHKVKLDTYYMNNQSLFLDLKILWLTFAKVLMREGVSH
jgi:O-antigen biosynthesis protein WbqP